MGYDRHPSNSSGYLIAAVAVGIAMFLGLLVVGGTMLVHNRRVAVAHEMVAVERLRVATVEGEARQRAEMAESAAQSNDASRDASGADAAEFQVFVDAAGTVRVANEEVNLEEMVIRLTDGDQRVQTVVKLNADPKCPFEHVAAVIKKCRDAGIQRVDVAP